MEIKRFGNPVGKKIMMLHGNLMCWRQFEDVIPLLEEEFDVYAVSFDGFDGTGRTTYTTAQEQADKLEDYLIQNCDGTLDALYAESLGCGPAVYLKASKNIQIHRMIPQRAGISGFWHLEPVASENNAPKAVSDGENKENARMGAALHGADGSRHANYAG